MNPAVDDLIAVPARHRRRGAFHPGQNVTRCHRCAGAEIVNGVSRVAKAFGDPEMGAIRAASAMASVFRWSARARGRHALTLPEPSSAEVRQVADAFDQMGSDKASLHSYAALYAALLTALPTRPQVLEVGLGTCFTDVPCNMGVDGVPGASLRAMRTVRPDGTFVGADVDRRILFTEDKISTFWVDQLEPASLADLRTQVGESGGCDLIIDDGLHTKRANLNTFRALHPALRPRGFYVIEDIDGSAIPVWRYLLTRWGCRHEVFDFRGRSGVDIDIAVVAQAA